MTTINTTEDLLRIARDNEEFRAALRRELLTEELLTTPSQVAHLLRTQAAMFEEVRELRHETNALRQDFNVMQQEIVSLRQETNVLRQTRNTMLDSLIRIEARLDRQHEMYRRQHDDLARFRGNYAIDAARNRDAEVAELFARQRGMRQIQVRPLTRDELDQMLNESLEALEALRLRDRAWLTFPKSDIIAEVTERRSSSPDFYIAVEASYTADTEDVLRATDHAKILRCVTGLDAYAVVAGVRTAPGIEGIIFDEVAQFAEANDEDSALWFQLEEDELEPPDPC